MFVAARRRVAKARRFFCYRRNARMTTKVRRSLPLVNSISVRLRLSVSSIHAWRLLKKRSHLGLLPPGEEVAQRQVKLIRAEFLARVIARRCRSLNEDERLEIAALVGFDFL